MNKLSQLLAITIMAALIAGCGGEPKQQKEEPVFDTNNTVKARLAAEPDRLNPFLTTNSYSRIVFENMFLYLLQFDPQTFELKPQLAKGRPEAEEITEGPYAGGMAYTFEFQEEAKWDNGTPITGEDMRFTLKVMFNPLVKAGPYRAYLEFIKDIEVDPENPKRFTIFSYPKYIIGEAAIGNMLVYPSYIYDPEGLMKPFKLSDLTDSEKATQLAESEAALQTFANAFNSEKFSREKGSIVSSGPYRFEKWDAGQEIMLVRKENWWGDKVNDESALLEAHPDTLLFKIIPDQTTTVAAVKDQQLDVAASMNSKDYKDLEENELVKTYYNLYSPSALQLYYIGINTKNPKVEDKRVRRALAHLVDVDQIIERLYYGLAERSVGPVAPSKPYFNDALKAIDFNVEKAKSLLEEAGWTDSNGNGTVDKMIDGELVEMELSFVTTVSSQFANNLAQLLEATFPRAGVKLNLERLEFSVLIDKLRSRQFEMFASAWAQDPILDDFKQIWHTESDSPSGSNRVGFGNAESDELIDKIRVTLDEGERTQMYKRFQEIVYDEQPYIFLFSPMERIAIHKRFEAKPSSLRPGFFVNEFKLKGSD